MVNFLKLLTHQHNVLKMSTHDFVEFQYNVLTFLIHCIDELAT